MADFKGTINFDGAVDFDSTVDMSGATVTLPTGQITPAAQSSGHRELAADAACVVAATDRTIELNLTTGTTAVTMTATHTGHTIEIYAGIRSGGSATIACTRGATSGTVTIDAVGEGARLKYNGSAWKLVDLLGTAGFA